MKSTLIPSPTHQGTCPQCGQTMTGYSAASVRCECGKMVVMYPLRRTDPELQPQMFKKY